MSLNPKKTILQPVDRGIAFVGHLIKPWCRSTRNANVANALRRLEHLPAAEVQQTANSYFGLLRQASHSHTDRRRLAKAVLKRGHCVKADCTKAYGKAA